MSAQTIIQKPQEYDVHKYRHLKPEFTYNNKDWYTCDHIIQSYAGIQLYLSDGSHKWLKNIKAMRFQNV